jgi:hypothetical protein
MQTTTENAQTKDPPSANRTSRNIPETPQIDKKNTASDHRILNHNLLQYTTILPNSD